MKKIVYCTAMALLVLVPLALQGAIIGISIPEDSQLTSRPLLDDVWAVSAPIDVTSGIGIIVNPTVIGGRQSFDFSLHQNGNYSASFIPNPVNSTVTFTFDVSQVVRGIEVVQHFNGITRIEGFLGNSVGSVNSLGSVFGPSGDTTTPFAEAVHQIFDFGNTTEDGTVFQVTVLKSIHSSAFANYRMYLLDENLNQISAVPEPKWASVAAAVLLLLISGLRVVWKRKFTCLAINRSRFTFPDQFLR